MSYAPTTDFLALLRQAASGDSMARMPGLDYVLSALARTGLFALSVGQTAPLVNQASTIWLLPATPSWTAEGKVFLWNSGTPAYELATPALWSALLSPSSYVFQSVAGASNVVKPSASLLAVQRTAPSVTTLVLPGLATRATKPLQIVDWSVAVVDHAITLTTADGATIMQRGSWLLRSTVDQLSGVTLFPSADLNGWVIAP